MKIKVDSKITIQDINKKVLEYCNKELFFPNPDVQKKKAMGFWTGNLQKNIKLYTKNGNELTENITALNVDIGNGNENANGKYINPQKIEFLRATEIYKDTRFVLISDKMDMNDIVPGALEDSYFLVSIQNLCKTPAQINKIFKTFSSSIFESIFLMLHISLLMDSF